MSVARARSRWGERIALRPRHISSRVPIKPAVDKDLTHHEGVVWVTAGNGCRCGPRPGCRLVMASYGSIGGGGDTLGTRHSLLGKCLHAGRHAVIGAR